MRNSRPGKKGKTYKHPVDFADAKEIAGGEAALRAKAATEETWRQWAVKDKKVPADVVIQFLLPWWRARRRLIQEAQRREYERVIAQLKPPEADSAAQPG